MIAGIMWIGNSLLFNWLDRNLRPRSESDSYGDIWLLHSGGFYLAEKNKGERVGGGLRLPTPLHWFKWQAYTTWLSGAALLIVVYYVGGRALLVDPAVYQMTHTLAVVRAVGMLVVGFVLYELIWRKLGPRWPRVALGASLILLADIVVGATYFFSGRAALIHVGAMLGTIMAGNVAFTIMPSQHELVNALRDGREPSQAIADRAKTRSIHNNYITFPVLALMLSAHFPSLYAGTPRNSALGVLAILAGGALVRHILNIRFHRKGWEWRLASVLAATAVALAAFMKAGPFAPSMSAATDSVAVPDVVSWADARRIIDRRCAACHSQTPSDVSLGPIPGGVAMDTPEQIALLAPRINERAVVQRTMPPANKTMMTALERAMLAKWVSLGAPIK